LKKVDINVENLKNLEANKLNELEKKVEKLDHLDLNNNNFCGLFASKISVNTNKNAVGNLNEIKNKNLEEKNNINNAHSVIANPKDKKSKFKFS